MCVVSMIHDHYYDKWKDRREQNIPFYPNNPPIQPIAPNDPLQQYEKFLNRPPAITDAEIREFRELLEKARKYDKENGQKDCGLADKKERLLKLAEELGVKIDFI